MREPMNEFARLLEAEIPRLRRYARALTRDVVRADDLVQSCLTRAIAKQHLWQPAPICAPGCSRSCIISTSTTYGVRRGRETRSNSPKHHDERFSRVPFPRWSCVTSTLRLG